MQGTDDILKGRGSSSRLAGRYATRISLAEEPVCDPGTRFHSEQCKTLLNANQSPDVPFSLSINPYRGCEHGCIYCFARPTHSYLDLSPGLDFETRIFCKDNAPQVLRRQLSQPGYRCQPVAIGAATDPYQPIERERLLTRRILQVLDEFNHPVTLISKGALILRDLDILAPMAARSLVSVAMSVTTLDNGLKAILEPRASAGSRRIEAIRALSEAGVPTTLLFAPVIPFINDAELEAIVAASADAGVRQAGYVMLRLPHEVAPLWRDWLQQHFPQRAGRIMAAVRALHEGRDYRSDWHQRQTGRGPWAALLAQRFRLACQRAGISSERSGGLRTDLFRVPGKAVQGELFGD